MSKSTTPAQRWDGYCAKANGPDDPKCAEQCHDCLTANAYENWHDQRPIGTPSLRSEKAFGECTLEVRQQLEGKTGVAFIEAWNRMRRNTPADGVKGEERYEVQRISDGKQYGEHVNFRVTDKQTDSRIATCYSRENADFIVAALNASTLAAPTCLDVIGCRQGQPCLRSAGRVATDTPPIEDAEYWEWKLMPRFPTWQMMESGGETWLRIKEMLAEHGHGGLTPMNHAEYIYMEMFKVSQVGTPKPDDRIKPSAASSGATTAEGPTAIIRPVSNAGATVNNTEATTAETPRTDALADDLIAQRLGCNSQRELAALRLLEGMDALTASALGTFLKGGDIPNTIDATRGALVRRVLEAEKLLQSANAENTCPHCGYGPGWSGLPECQQTWAGDPTHRPKYPRCPLRAADRSA